MKTIFSLIMLAAIVAAGIIGYNWITGNNKLQIVSPDKGSTIYNNSVQVRLRASDSTQAALTTTGNDYQIVSYVDGKEVHRGKELSYDLNNLSAGQHELKVAIADNREGINLNNIALQPGAVDFTVAPSAANPRTDLNFNTNTLVSSQSGDVAPEPTPVPVNAAASNPAQSTQASAPAALPASGEGGGQRLQQVAIPSSSNNYQPVAFTRLGPAAPPPPETPMQSAFRSLFAFYAAAFVVGFGFVFFSIRRRLRRREQLMRQ
jgi:hypothetical protein